MPRVLHYKSTYLNLSETFVDRFVRAHERYDVSVATVRPVGYTEEVDLFAPRHAVDRLLNVGATKLNRTPPTVFRAARERQVDVLHAHFGLDGYRLLGGARRLGLPLVTTFYGYDTVRLPRERGWAKRYSRLAQEGTLFVTASEDHRRDMISLGFPSDRLRVVKLGLDVDSIRFVARETSGPRIMLIGRMVEKKGMSTAIEALRIAREQNEAVTLDIYGDGPLRAEIEDQIAQSKLGDCVTLHGAVANSVIVEALYDHGVLLVPSVSPGDGDKEGIPQTIVEGMATGIPVIGSTHAGIPELVRDDVTGLVAPERDAPALAAAIGRLTQDDALAARLSVAGRKAVRELHHLPMLVARLEACYDEAIEINRERS